MFSGAGTGKRQSLENHFGTSSHIIPFDRRRGINAFELTMASRCTSVLLIFMSVVVAWVAAVPVQAGANTLRRDFYGPATTEYLGGYLEDHGSSRNEDRGWDRSHYIGGGSPKGSISTLSVSQERSSHSRSENEHDSEDRPERNLDQIGGGNLLRRKMTQRWLGTRANLDQIGGGNLVRNLDQ
ncbi:orcokinin peptides-like, partial [Hylaeus anthracinus]|uniref:orcokinin peptides-like n=1 Tax=Hylaeus anthracinus TaxID=313031 RepID=UPI0023B91E94